MRARRTLRAATATRFAVGATALAFPATALAVSNAGGSPAPGPAPSLHTQLRHHVAYGALTVVRGTAPAHDAGTPLALRYSPADGRGWRTVATGTVGPRGQYAIPARIGRTGQLQVVPTGQAPAFTAQRAQAVTGTGTVASPGDGTRLVAGPVEHVSVAPQVSLFRRADAAIAGQRTEIGGRLLPALPGRRVVLQLREGRRWVDVASSRTRRDGRFGIAFAPSAGGQTVQVAFRGDQVNARAESPTAAVSAMEYATVSWYNDAGSTACGFHATYGIASRTLPCGSHVTMSYGGRTVTTTVDDRGPFVYSRLYDLNQNVAAALGMSGVATVLASV